MSSEKGKRFPHSPSIRSNPFRDDQGHNRFADDSVETGSASSDNAYQSPTSSAASTAELDFAQTQTSRGGSLLTGSISFLLVSFLTPLVPIFGVCVLILGTTAVVLCRQHLTAMKHGVMSSQDRKLVRLAMACSIASLFVSAGGIAWSLLSF